ncbi:MAG: zinc ribbon domain-containing protein [Chloroflexi bacterium]|nr:zinc ribbon domain-containing protein [Chloroflexota bacterium]
MKNSWKWVLIIVLVFLVAFFLGAVLFFAIGYSRVSAGATGIGLSSGFFRTPWTMNRSPMMGGLRGGWFGMGWKWLLGSGIFVLILWGISSLMHSGSHASTQTQASAASTSSASSTPVVSAPAEPAALAHCTNCAQALQPEWIVCPHCGTKVEPKANTN